MISTDDNLPRIFLLVVVVLTTLRKIPELSESKNEWKDKWEVSDEQVNFIVGVVKIVLNKLLC